MRELASGVESPAEAHAMVVTAGVSAAHMALMIIKRAQTRQNIIDESGVDVIGGRDHNRQVIDAAIAAWETVYAFRGL
jgi:hypothetical protein